MKELVNNWNEKHPEYVLVHGMYSYVDNGQSKDMHMLTIFNKDNECVCEYKGEDFIKLYNTLEEATRFTSGLPVDARHKA